MLSDGFHDVPAGKLATIVTHLEMTHRAPERVIPLPDGLSFRQIETPTAEAYRDLMWRVGSVAWLWFSRLLLSEDDLTRIIQDPKCALYTLEMDGTPQAMLELDFRVEGDCELAFFGVAPPLIGKGAGRYLMNQAIALAWAQPIKRFHVHTCTLDSPGALNFYIRSGFTPIRQQVEIVDDPRLGGVLPRDAGPHIPIFDL